MSVVAIPSEPFLLSDAGSTRATAYNMSNKSVRVGSKTHVTWLDAVSGVRVRTYDHETGEWSATVAVDDGHDNHTNPAMSRTPEGKLRIAYGPHGFWEGNLWNAARFKLVESDRPGDVSSWTHYSSTGYGATYACLVTDSEGRDHLVYRGGTVPPSCFYERRQPNNVWDLVTKLSGQRNFSGYTFVGANLVVGPKDVLYCGFMYYSIDIGRSVGVCVLKSEDAGESWMGVDGRPVQLPLLYDPAFAVPHKGNNPYLGSLAVDLDGNLVGLTMDAGESRMGTFLSVHRNGEWQTTQLEPFMPEGWQLQHGNVTVDAKGRILVVMSACDARVPVEEMWGHPSTECFLLASGDGGRTFRATQLSPTSSDAASWLPNISRVGPGHDLSRPVVLYTHGVAGEGCQPPDRTEVYAVWID